MLALTKIDISSANKVDIENFFFVCVLQEVIIRGIWCTFTLLSSQTQTLISVTPFFNHLFKIKGTLGMGPYIFL